MQVAATYSVGNSSGAVWDGRGANLVAVPSRAGLVEQGSDCSLDRHAQETTSDDRARFYTRQKTLLTLLEFRDTVRQFPPS